MFIPGRSTDGLLWAILDSLEGNETVLNLAAGTGDMTLEIASVLDRGVVYALGTRRDLLGRLELRAYKAGLSRRIRTIHGDPASTGLSSRSMDLVVFFGMLHAAPEPEAILSEAWRVLEPGGRLVVKDLGDSFRGRLRGLLRSRGSHRPLGPGELGRQLEATGFTSIETRGSGGVFLVAEASRPRSGPHLALPPASSLTTA